MRAIRLIYGQKILKTLIPSIQLKIINSHWSLKEYLFSSFEHMQDKQGNLGQFSIIHFLAPYWSVFAISNQIT